MERKPCDLPSYRIKAGKNDGIGRIVNDDLYAGKRLQRPDITTFTTDNPALDLFIVDIEYGDGIFDGMLTGCSLDGLNDDLFRLHVSCHFGFINHILNMDQGF